MDKRQLVLFVLVGLIQYPLWLGKGGWFKVWDLQRQVAAQRETNEGLRLSLIHI